ncbi:negative elongation factor A isoform X2 [Sitophilus oryzae]|uniref:Negative elongation factor A isoform X2 n=1 Tax=Sitophilus oryzae TaxID=7048 RepID=A0A6J2XF89_SITOR|nr:negative elongation factor A isoform X2 [Sitophilus oryzae]
MANVRDSDTSLWLHNKLGISNDSWTGGSICSQLNAEVLRNIKDCFPDLQTQVKLKLLLSFFHVPRRNLEEWKLELEQILDVALQDSELWVAMIADALKTYPSTGSLNTEITDVDEVRSIFSDLLSDLRKHVRKQNEHTILPMECHYLNKNALISVVGHKPEPIKHFTIKKKPKSALLRADLLQKSSDAASNLKKSSAPVIPVRSRGMPRKMTDTTPLKGIPSRVPTSGFRTSALSSNMTNRPLVRPPAGRKEGGVKLLDIADQPLGYTATKKRKKQQEMEENQAKKAQQENALQSPPPVKGETPTTPDYAAGLGNTTPAYAPATPQPTVAPTGASLSALTAPATPATPAPPATPKPATTQLPAPASSTAQMATLTPITPQTASPTTQLSSPPPQVQHIQIQTQPQVVSPQIVTPQYITTQNLRPVPPLLATTPSGQRTIITTDQATGIQTQQIITGTPVVVTQRPAQQQQTVTHIRIQPQPATNFQRRGLALTREQMLEAQDMFRTANKVTRPEKALILGFMAGSRDNPCPHLGNIVTIKLSEDQENVLQPDDTYVSMMVETHFQMNYNNGEWKRIKKYRHVSNEIEHVQQNQAAAALV